jgi:membrane-associated phospholipid phosphatase
MRVAASLLIVAVGVRRRQLVVRVLVGYAVVICLSRFVLGVRFRSDSVAGGAFGIAVTVTLAFGAFWTGTGTSTVPKGPRI